MTQAPNTSSIHPWIPFCLRLLASGFILFIASGCAPIGGREYQERERQRREQGDIDSDSPDDSRPDSSPDSEDGQGSPPDDSADRDSADDSGGHSPSPATSNSHSAAARAFLADVGTSYADNFEQIASEIEVGKFQSWDEVFELWAERNRLDRENAWKTHMQARIFDAAGGEGAPMTPETTRAVAKLAREAAVGLRAGRSPDSNPTPRPPPRNIPPAPRKTDRRRRL